MIDGRTAENEAKNSTDSLPDWWEHCHQVDHDFFLTGSDRACWDVLKVTDLIVPAANVLEIGVGLGQSAEALRAAKCMVSVLDIAPTAIARVPWAQGYLNPADLPSDTFDVAMSHLVAQHMMDTDLFAQMRHVIRSLKPSGVFAIQFAGGVAEHTLFSARAGGCLRTPAKMADMAIGAGAGSTKVFKGAGNVQVGWQHYTIHLRR